MSNPLGLQGISYIGYIEALAEDVDECRDYFKHIRQVPRREFETQLKDGTLPPGLVIVPDGMVPGVIVGRGQSQAIKPYEPSQGIRIR